MANTLLVFVHAFAAVLYYLSYARYLSKIFKPAEILSDVFKKNNYIPVIESDSDND